MKYQLTSHDEVVHSLPFKWCGYVIIFLDCLFCPLTLHFLKIRENPQHKESYETRDDTNNQPNEGE